MDIKQIQELVKIINKTSISEISIEEEGLKITIKQKDDTVIHQLPPAQVFAQAPLQQVTAVVPQHLVAETNAPQAPAKNDDHLIMVRSPMVGTFYRSPSPDKPVFVNIGDEINPGKVVCIIEAMKLFNEIESEVKGKIVKIIAEDASPVDYNQPLFLVDPS